MRLVGIFTRRRRRKAARRQTAAREEADRRRRRETSRGLAVAVVVGSAEAKESKCDFYFNINKR